MSRPSKLQSAKVSAAASFPGPEIGIDCEAFQGSLAALLEVVRRGGFDLTGVQLAPVCRAYVSYLLEIDAIEPEAAVAGLSALAYLLERKAWALVPGNNEPPEPDEDPIPLEPYASEFQPAIEHLVERQKRRNELYFRSSEPDGLYEVPLDLGGATADDLARAFRRLMERAQPEPPTQLSRPRRSLADQMLVVAQSLSQGYRPLEEIVPEPFTREEAVWWFLALLELIRLGQAKVRFDAATGEVRFGRPGS